MKQNTHNFLAPLEHSKNPPKTNLGIYSKNSSKGTLWGQPYTSKDGRDLPSHDDVKDV